MTTTRQAILEILEQSREGLTTPQILDQLIDYDKFPTACCLAAVLSQLKTKNNWVYNDKQTLCPGCGLKRARWHISEDGLIRVTRNK